MIRRLIGVLVVSFLISLTVIGNANADDLAKRIGVGLGNPYLSLKYGLNSKLSAEARYAFGSGVNAYGARLYYNFNPENQMVIFTGLEGDYIRFDRDGVSGNGYAAYLLVGGEYFIAKNFTFGLDIGPAFIKLEEDELSVDGVEYIFNLGVNLYFK